MSRSDTNPTASNGSRSMFQCLIADFDEAALFDISRFQNTAKGALIVVRKGRSALAYLRPRRIERVRLPPFRPDRKPFGQFRGSAMLDFR